MPNTVLELGESVSEAINEKNPEVGSAMGSEIIRSPKQVVGPIANVDGLRSIFVFVASVKQDGKPDFTANIVELTNVAKAQVHQAELDHFQKSN